MDVKLTPTMQAAIEYARARGGVLVRWPGGFWMRVDADYAFDESFGTPTVQALVTRGLATYTDWKDGRRGRFPIRVELCRPCASPSGGSR